MGNVILPRRAFLAGLAAAITAPAIVRVASIMPVKAMVDPIRWPYGQALDNGQLSLKFAELLQHRVAAADREFARVMRQRLDDLLYRTGTGTAGALSELIA